MGVRGSERMAVSVSWKMHTHLSCSIHLVTTRSPATPGKVGAGPGARGAQGTVWKCWEACLGEEGRPSLSTGGCGVCGKTPKSLKGRSPHHSDTAGFLEEGMNAASTVHSFAPGCTSVSHPPGTPLSSPLFSSQDGDPGVSPTSGAEVAHASCTFVICLG